MKIADAGKLLCVREAACILGVKESTLRAWILRRKIGYSKLGAAVRIPTAEAERLISRGFVPARNETKL